MKIVSKQCKGTYARETPDMCPPDFLLDGKNLFLAGSGILSPRPGFRSIPPGETKSNVTHLSVFEPTPVLGVVSPKIIVHTKAGPANIYNNTDFPGASIWSGGSSHHSWINFFGKGYFVLHNTIVGSAAEKLQVYEGGATSRDALGIKPVSAMLGAAGAGGNLGVGSYLVDVCYVTTSGFVTKPSGTVLKKDCFGSYKIDLTVIPIGPAGTAARRIIMTKAIPLGSYTGNPNDYEFFFAPSGLINNNVATIFTLSEFDGNLISSADFLLDNLESLNSGVGIGEYNARMLVWGENGNPSIIRISKPGDPETFSATSGFIIVDPTESGGVTNCIVLRNNLYIFKSNRIFVATDNGGDPTTWPLTLYDAGIGAETYSINKIFDSKGTHLNQFLIGSRSGIVIFDGLVRFPELTYYVQDIWDDIDPLEFSKTQVVLDSINKGIYVTLTRTSGDKQLLYGDYTDGLTSEAIKWFLWESVSGGITGGINAIMVEFNAGLTISIYLGMVGIVANFDPANPQPLDDSGLAINLPITCTLQTPVITVDESVDIQQITVVKMRQKKGSVGDITVQAISAADSAVVSPVYTMPFTNAPTKIQDRWIYLPFVDNQPTLKFQFLSTNRPEISKITIEGDVYGESGPR